MKQGKPLPEVVTADEWQKARDELLAQEKEALATLDAVAARRRRLPMTEFATDYAFEGPDGTKTLLELFDGRDRLVVYQFMNLGPDTYCPGCTWYTHNVPESAVESLAESGVSYVQVSDMPLPQIEKYKAYRGWTMPFLSSRGTSFTEDTGAGGFFLFNVFLRDGDKVYRTYSTTGRGIDQLAFVTKILDLTPYGRGEAWEDSPSGWPQVPTDLDAPMDGMDHKPVSWGRYR